MNGDFNTHQSIQDYYGQVLKSSADLQTSACCLIESPPSHVLAALKNVHPEVKDRHHHFVAHKPMLVCHNTADLLSGTRYARHFKVMGDKSTHFGVFESAVLHVHADASTGAVC